MHDFVNVWRSILVVSSWIGIGLGLCAFLTKTGIGFLVGAILIVFSVGGFMIAGIIKRWLEKETNGVTIGKSYPSNSIPAVSIDDDGNEWVVIDGNLFIKDPSSGNFERFHNNRVKA